jgi:hypothetical protein
MIEPTGPRKSLLPSWLVDDLVQKQGVRFDASGYPEKIGMESSPQPQRLSGIQRAWLKKS